MPRIRESVYPYIAIRHGLYLHPRLLRKPLTYADFTLPCADKSVCVSLRLSLRWSAVSQNETIGVWRVVSEGSWTKIQVFPADWPHWRIFTNSFSILHCHFNFCILIFELVSSDTRLFQHIVKFYHPHYCGESQQCRLHQRLSPSYWI